MQVSKVVKRFDIPSETVLCPKASADKIFKIFLVRQYRIFFFTASRSEHDVRNRNQENTGLPDMEYFENLVRQLAILTLCFPFSFSTVSLSQSLPFG